MKLHFTILGLLLSVCAFGQEPVKASSDPESLFKDKDKKLNAVKQVAMHIERDLLEAGHWSDLGPMYLTERYIQHNPAFASGRDTVMKAFGARPATPIPDKDHWRTKVVSVVANGDMVVVATLRELPDPRTPGQTYTTTWFDMWRIKDGKADEHWDYGTINPPNAQGKGKGKQ